MQSMETIENFGFQINNLKSNILSDRIEKKNLTDLCGIKVVDKFKYLGVNISLDRKTLIADAKNSAKKFLIISGQRFKQKVKNSRRRYLGPFTKA